MIGIAAAILIPAVAVAADQLIGSDEVAASMPAGTLGLAGTEPTCTVVQEERRVPLRAGEAAGARGVGLEGHRRADGRRDQPRQRRLPLAGPRGTEWECYIGQAAVDQQIIGEEFLGEESSGPGVG